MSVFIRGSAFPRAPWPRITRAQVTASVGTPVSLADAKAELRIQVDDDNAQIQTYLRVATQKVETDTGHALLTQTWDFTYDQFPAAPVWDLPIAPVQSVTSITYQDSAGAPQVWASSGHYLLSGGRIGLADAAVWPTDLRRFAPITVRVVAGYTSAALIPADLLQAVRFWLRPLEARRDLTPLEQRWYETLITPYVTVLVA